MSSPFSIAGEDSLNAALSSYFHEWNGHDDGGEVKALITKNAVDILKERFCNHIAFGTAGLRGRMESGFNRMNKVTVERTSHGLAMYLKKALGDEEAKTRGVTIGYDARHHSTHFAHICAAVFLSYDVSVALFDDICPTPLLAFATAHRRAGCGIMITASHNPKDDNGYKVYWENGAQIIPPIDENIAACIAQAKCDSSVASLLDNTKKQLTDDAKKRVSMIDSTFSKTYNDITIEQTMVNKTSLQDFREKVVYTAMHGVGGRFMEDIVKQAGFQELLCVPQQHKPDPEFTTVRFPNPEEAGALDLAISMADQHNAKLLIANDPDADRFAAGEREKGGKFHIFSGDEIGILFAAYRLQQLQSKSIKSDKILFICSAVSSKMMAKMCEVEGAMFEETMTGFKWMANKSIDLRNDDSSLHHALAYEEALGYQLTQAVPDKDGLSAAVVWLEMSATLYKEGSSIIQRLDELRQKYGYFVTNNFYVICDDPTTLETIFNDIRRDGKYIEDVEGYTVKSIRDVTEGYDSSQSDKKCRLPTSGSYMVTIIFQNGTNFTARSSGTEPKLKWYAEFSGTNAETAQAELDKMIDVIVPSLFQMKRFNLSRA